MNSFKKTFLVNAFLTLALFAGYTTQAQGTLEVSTLGATPTGSAAIASDMWAAQRFFTSAPFTSYTLTSIQLLMDPAMGNPGGFSVSIYNSYSYYSDLPRQNIGNLSGPNPSAGGLFTYTTPGITISPILSYFVVITSTLPGTLGNYNWSVASEPNGQSGNLDIDDVYDTSANGLVWTQTIRGNVFQMAIYATPAPEPSAFALLGLGAVILISATN